MASPLPPAPTTVRVRVPAKINLALCVGSPGADDFHPLATVFQAVSLHDEVYAEWADEGTFAVETQGVGADLVPSDDTNLAVRAARLLAEAHAPAEPLGVRMSVKKSIPVSGGMAGGSADAAAALLACAVLWDLDVDPDQLRELGAELGSDVPFGLLGGTAVGSGRGELLVPALARGTYHWVLAFGNHGLSTPAVYSRFDELGGADLPMEVPAGLMNALSANDPVALGRSLRNDLQPAALDLQPQLGSTLEAGLELGAVGAVVSGSGPTCAFLARDESAAVDLSVALSSEGVCKAVRRVSGPVPGARIHN
ncbi:MAG: 4-(cytidine 5'-diphospho)-2-C-methyl-D-erythritol kinase [Propionibacteriaceae bacterium]